VLSETEVRELLVPFGLNLSPVEVSKLLAYLELLLSWNRRINLVSVTSPQECLTRHFGESLYLACWHRLHGRLLDVGSGAGFPGLALKIVFPDLATTLLEPVAKKRAFLKEVARECGFASVEVRRERLEDYARTQPEARFDCVTARAVGGIAKLIQLAAGHLEPSGLVCLWLGSKDSAVLVRDSPQIVWEGPIRIPLSRQREILCGRVG